MLQLRQLHKHNIERLECHRPTVGHIRHTPCMSYVDSGETGSISSSRVQEQYEQSESGSIMLTRQEVAENGADLTLHFAVHHHNASNSALLGQVTTSLSELCGDSVDEFSEWAGNASGDFREFSLMSRGKDGADPTTATQGTLQILLTNRDPAHVRDHINSEQVREGVARRRAAQQQRWYIYRTDELACLADIRLELKGMKQRQINLFSALLLDFCSFRIVMKLVEAQVDRSHAVVLPCCVCQ